MPLRSRRPAPASTRRASPLRKVRRGAARRTAGVTGARSSTDRRSASALADHATGQPGRPEPDERPRMASLACFQSGPDATSAWLGGRPDSRADAAMRERYTYMRQCRSMLWQLRYAVKTKVTTSSNDWFPAQLISASRPLRRPIQAARHDLTDVRRPQTLPTHGRRIRSLGSGNRGRRETRPLGSLYQDH
jgi:hypothetical protein